MQVMKSEGQPKNPTEGQKWIRPDGSRWFWQKGEWREIPTGTARHFQDGISLNSVSYPSSDSEEGLEEPEIDPDSLEEIEVEIENDQSTTEDSIDEQGMQTEVPDRDGGEQGSSGGPSSEPKQRGQRGKVRKGRKGK